MKGVGKGLGLLLLLGMPLAAQAQTYSRTDKIVYHDNLSEWVLGQSASSTNVNTGVIEFKTDYDPVTASPVRYYGAGTASVPGELKQTLTYNTDGTVATVKDGNSNVITLSSWKRGIPQSIKYPITPESPTGAVQSAVVDNNGWITSVTDENGYKTCYGYDSMGRVNLITYPSETTAGVCDTSAWTPTTITFAGGNTAAYGVPAGHWRQTTLTGNGRKILVFDALWRPVVEQTLDLSNVSGTLSEVIKRYDAEGRVIFQSYPMNTNGQANYADAALKGVFTAYDALGRTTSVTQDSELGLLTTLTTYQTGFKTQVTNPKLQQTTTSYLAYDQPSYDWPVAITHPEGAFTDITRDVFGKPTVLKRRNSASSLAITRGYAYNANQELCRSVEPETGVTLMGYDGAGNLTWSASGLSPAAAPGCHSTGDQTSINPRKAVRTYDARNRVKTLSFPDGVGNQTWTYAPDGLPTRLFTYNTPSNINGGTTVANDYTYNKRRLLATETLITPDLNWPLTYTYNANGHLTAQIWHGLTIDYVPNALGQPTKAGTYASGVSYYPNGAIKQFTYGNGIVHTMTQNARQLPSRSTDCTLAGACAATNQRLDLGYAYDKHANVTAITDYTTGGRQTRGMTYDNLDRLTQTTSGSTVFGTATYGYNVLDNLTTVNVTGGSKTRNHTYVYDASNQLTNVKKTLDNETVVGLDYDEQGNLENKNGVLYDFDFGNRLRTVTDTTGAKTSAYIYDGLGRRVRDTVNGLSKHSHYLQNGQLSMVGDSRTNDVTEYVYLGGSLIATRARDVTTNVYTTTYQHTDALGTPVATTGSTGAFIEKSEYEPFGQQVNVVGAAKDGPGYTGHVQDAATGLVQMQQRYYDPLLGRFLSVDPITANGNSGGNFNRYWYASNNPYKLIDPDGRAPRNKDDPPRLQCPTVNTCRRERQREKNEKRKKEKQGLVQQIASALLGTPETPNHTNSGLESPDPDKWRVAATVYDTNSATVDSSGPILIQPGSLAFPAPTFQFYYTVYQRPLGSNGQLENVAATASWFKPVVHGSGGTGLFDRAAYRFSTDVVGSGGSRWYIEIRNSESTHDNGQDPFLNIYVPVDR